MSAASLSSMAAYHRRVLECIEPRDISAAILTIYYPARLSASRIVNGIVFDKEKLFSAEISRGRPGAVTKVVRSTAPGCAIIDDHTLNGSGARTYVPEVVINDAVNPTLKQYSWLVELVEMAMIHSHRRTCACDY